MQSSPLEDYLRQLLIVSTGKSLVLNTVLRVCKEMG